MKSLKNLLIVTAASLYAYFLSPINASAHTTYEPRKMDKDVKEAYDLLDDPSIKDAIHGIYWNTRNISEGLSIQKSGVPANFIGMKGFNVSTNEFFDYTTAQNVFRSQEESAKLFSDSLSENLTTLYDALENNPTALAAPLVDVVVAAEKKAKRHVFDVQTKSPVTYDL
jgi:hypothetical protein